MGIFRSAGLYLVTSSELSDRPTLEIIEQSLKAGCRLFQLREKTLTRDQYKELAFQARTLAERYGALFIVNDHVDVALDVGADGVHLGQDDMSINDARKILGSEFMIGVSTHNIQEAVNAQVQGADYINIGPAFPTNTKPDAISLGLDGIEQILPYVKIPFTFMGGIKLDNVDSLKAFKPAAVAVITGLTRSPSLTVDISAFLS
jgi:thiamine-phosphate pyrophosphorylase